MILGSIGRHSDYFFGILSDNIQKQKPDLVSHHYRHYSLGFLDFQCRPQRTHLWLDPTLLGIFVSVCYYFGKCCIVAPAGKQKWV